MLSKRRWTGIEICIGKCTTIFSTVSITATG